MKLVRRGVTAVVLALLIAPLAAEAQQPGKKISRIGFLANIRSPGTDAFEQGLRELGYIEGKNIVVEWRLAQGRFERLPELAADLVRLDVDVIVAPALPYVRAASKATTAIPIVFANVGDPVGEGFVASLARPGGNVTGMSTISNELVSKRLEFLKETLPGLARVAVFYDWKPGDWRRDLEAAARALKIRLQFLEVRDSAEFDSAFSRMVRERAEAVMVLGSVHFYPHRTRFAELAVKHRLPSILDHREYAEAGGLMVYAADTYDVMHRTAKYVDRILKGAKPSDLPVEQPTRFELVVNLKTAKALGLTIPPSVLVRATEVIE